MNLLLVTTVLPHRLSTGGEIATQNFIAGLVAGGHAVDVIGYLRPNDPAPIESHYHSAGFRHIETEAAGARAYGWLARAMLSGNPYIVQKYISTRLKNEVRDFLRREKYDAVIIDHAQMGWLLDSIGSTIPKIFIAHNIESRLYLDQSTNDNAHGKAKRLILRRDAKLIDVMEHRLATSCEQVWTLTVSEAEYFARITASNKIRVMGLPGRGTNGSVPGRCEARIDVGLLGSWIWEVNRHGLEWFTRYVVPLIPREITISVAGRGADLVEGIPERVQRVGFVEDPLDFLASCRVVVIPTTTGAGIQLKTIDAISVGRSIVSTSLGLRGIEDLPSYVQIADSPQAMAVSIIDAVKMNEARRADQGLDWLRRREIAFIGDVGMALSSI
ncbi:sugar transferase, PEP-CTERM/EpsH1 system associated [compost metagenome]